MYPSVLLTAGLAGMAAAAPAVTTKMGNTVVPKSTFSVPQINNPKPFIAHGAYQKAKAYMKFGKQLPDGLSKIMADLQSLKATLNLKRDNGSDTATPEQHDIQYLSPVSIGTPAQTLNLDFDSGSSDLWVFSSETNNVNGQAQYNPSSSNTSKEVSGASWDISYGDGSSSSGNVYTDKVDVGGVSFDAQAVETAKKVSKSFTSDSNNDGLLGLAFSSINTVKPKPQKTFFDNIRDNLEQPLWTADLKHNQPGTYNFGWIDKSRYTGDIAYTQVDSSNGFWMITVDSYSVGSGNSSNTTGSSTSGTPSSSPLFGSGGKSSSSSGSDQGGFDQATPGWGESQGSSSTTSTSDPDDNGASFPSYKRQSSGTSIKGIADTGTTLALLPTEVVKAYYAQVPGAKDDSSVGGYVFSCNAKLPDFTYTVGNVDITIPGDYINYAPADNTGVQCYGGIQDDSNIGFSIFGDIALKSAFVVFENDGSSPRLGFAKKAL